MRNVNPFVGLFVAMATLMAAFFVPVFVLLIDNGERLAAIEATVAAMRVEYGERMADIEAASAALARDVAANNERMAERPDNLDNPGSEG